MLLKILINYIVGYVSISIEGYYIERFINTCISKKIVIWNIKRKKSSLIYANIGIKDFKRLKDVAKKTKCRINIEEKKGLPFIFNKYKKRRVFVLLLSALFIVIIGLSQFIWNIEIICSDNINKEEIISCLEKNGLSTGKFKASIDTKNIVSKIRLERNDIAWMGINIDGTNARVEIVEADKKPDIIDPEDYCNIISDKEAVITKIVPKNGTATVKVGDVVKKGTILIGGWIEGKYTGTRYVHSEGQKYGIQKKKK